jgi:hypothetical protein
MWLRGRRSKRSLFATKKSTSCLAIVQVRLVRPCRKVQALRGPRREDADQIDDPRRRPPPFNKDSAPASGLADSQMSCALRHGDAQMQSCACTRCQTRPHAGYVRPSPLPTTCASWRRSVLAAISASHCVVDCITCEPRRSEEPLQRRAQQQRGHRTSSMLRKSSMVNTGGD